MNTKSFKNKICLKQSRFCNLNYPASPAFLYNSGFALLNRDKITETLDRSHSYRASAIAWAMQCWPTHSTFEGCVLLLRHLT